MEDAHTNGHSEKSKSEYACATCDRKYSDEERFMEHQNECKGKTKASEKFCNICKVSYNSVSILRSHMKRKHEGKIKVFKCKLCSKEFNRQTDLTRHINRGCNGIMDNLTCEVCEIKFSSSSNLGRHIRNRHIGTCTDSVQCSRCSKIFMTQPGLTLHKKTCEKMPVIQVCTICEIQFADRNSLRRHLKRKHEIETDVSNKLDAIYDFKPRVQTFKSKAEKDASQTETDVADFISVKVEKDADSESEEDLLRSNPQELNDKQPDVSSSLDCLDNEDSNSEALAVSEDENNKSDKEAETKSVSLQCNICSKTFTSLPALCGHRQMHSIKKTCIICEEVFNFGPDWTKHLKMHKNNERKCCHICGKSFESTSGFNKHMQKHNGVFYSCEICERRFSAKQTLQIHMNVHKGVKPYICEVCGERFRQRSHQIRHHRIHTGERKYKCEICHKGFIDSTALKCHMKTHPHLGLRTLHTCNVCGKKLASAAVLKVHKRTHSLKRDFKCKLCEREFTTYHSLKSHSKMHTLSRTAIRPAMFTKPTVFCDICPKGFVNKRGLARHKQKHAMGTLKRHNKYVGGEDVVGEAQQKGSRNTMNNVSNTDALAAGSEEKDLFALPGSSSFQQNMDFYDQLRNPSQGPTGRDVKAWESIRFSKPRTVQSDKTVKMGREVNSHESNYNVNTKRSSIKLDTSADNVGLNLIQGNPVDAVHDDDDTIIEDGDMFNDDFIPNISEAYKEVHQFSSNANVVHGSLAYNKPSIYGSAFKAIDQDKRNTNKDNCSSSHNNKTATYVFEVDDCSDCAVQCMRCSEMFYSPVLLMIHLKQRCIRRF